MRERGQQRADAVRVSLEVIEANWLAGAGEIDVVHILIDPVHEELTCLHHISRLVDTGEADVLPLPCRRQHRRRGNRNREPAACNQNSHRVSSQRTV
jgi:hypothetical protein